MFRKKGITALTLALLLLAGLVSPDPALAWHLHPAAGRVAGPDPAVVPAQYFNNGPAMRRGGLRPPRMLPPRLRGMRRPPRRDILRPARPRLPRAGGRNAPIRVAPSEALRLAQRRWPSSIGLSVRLLREGRPVYAVKLRAGNRVVEVLVDARTGRLLQ